MIDRTKFNSLNNEEKRVMAASIGYPDYDTEDKDELFEELDRCYTYTLTEADVKASVLVEEAITKLFA